MSSFLAIWGILISHRVRLMAVPEVKPKQQVKALCSVTALSPNSGTPIGLLPLYSAPSHSVSLPFDKSFPQSDLLLTPKQEQAPRSRSCAWLCRAPALVAPVVSSHERRVAVFFPPIFVSNWVFSLQCYHFSHLWQKDRNTAFSLKQDPSGGPVAPDFNASVGKVSPEPRYISSLSFGISSLFLGHLLPNELLE